ncbi:MAG: 1-acyl-sn-glycerol-3-phosphate acyltransferase [Myxococcales bacterium]|nr:1-acyl-sn-glycerol-3-phosphate acyltransferase [Myxococcales bacterium]
MLARRVGSTAFWIFMVVSSALMFPFAAVLWLVTVPFDRRLRALHQLTCFWASIYTWLSPMWRVRVTGRESLRASGPRIYVANHASLLDILVLFRLFTHFKWVSKAENFRIPFVGWNMTLNRYIKLRRGDAGSVAAMMAACERAVRAGSSIMIFPEGTRSMDGRLRPFKHGAFTLAQRLRVPIVPIVVEGTARALPKAGYLLQGRHAIALRVLAPIAPDSWPEGPPEVLAEHVRAVFLRELGPGAEPDAVAPSPAPSRSVPLTASDPVRKSA